VKHIAIIGTGMAGITLARQLDRQAKITLFEKSRGVSGRLSTRRLGDHEFDHGAQFFTARSKSFQQFLAPFISKGLVAQWQPKALTLAFNEKPYKRDWFEPHYVAVPRMNSLCKHLSDNLDINLKTNITGLKKSSARDSPGWILHTGDTVWQETFDWVISTAPANQTMTLFKDHLAPEFLLEDTGLTSAKLSPCYSLMLGFSQSLSLGFEAARVKNLGIKWIMVNSSKPGRPQIPTLVVQSSNQWAEDHLKDSDDQVITQMMTELESVLDQPLPETAVQSLQRWRYSRVEQTLEPDYLLDLENSLAGSGDWCLSGRVEGAFLSAKRLARRMGQIL
jgi:renalase